MKYCRKIRKRFFNMIEIALAMGVIAVGLSSILGLFPIAMNSANESIGDNEMANIAETFLNTLQAQLEAEEASSFTESSVLGGIGTKCPDGTPTKWDKLPGTTMYSGGNGIFRVNTNEWQADSSGSDTPGGDFNDAFNEFDGAEIRVWYNTQSDLQDFYFNGNQVTNSVDTASLNPVFTTLFAEVSYPALRPYDQRTKRTFRLDLLNQRNSFQSQ